MILQRGSQLVYCVIPENVRTSPTERIFSKDPPPPGNSNPFCGGVWIFSGTAHYALLKVGAGIHPIRGW